MPGELSAVTNALHVKALGRGTPAVLVHGSGGSCEGHGAQEPLALHHRLLMPERRGYPRSPPAGPVDYETDGRDIADLLGDAAHLVGKSYGGVGSLLAAALRPGAVLSLAVVEPPLLGLVRGNPEADGIMTRLTRVYETMQDSSPEEFDAAFDAALGLSHEPAVVDPMARGALAAMMKERLPFDALIPFDRLAVAPFPKLVVSGGWNEGFTGVCDVVARRIHGEHTVIRGAGHAVGGTGKRFNDTIETLWSSGESKFGRG